MKGNHRQTPHNAYEIALEHHRSGELQAAETIYRSILEAEPRHAEVWHMLGVLALQMGRYQVAIGVFQQAIAISPSAAENYSNLGEAYRAMGRSEEAIASYRRAILLDPNLAGAHSNLGIALKDNGDMAGAISAFRQAIQIKPDFAEAHSNLGHALRLTGELEEAAQSYKLAIQLCPSLLSARTGHSEAMLGLVPPWHIPMINDQARNEFYLSALKSVVTPESNVFEIGTGSGLLSMMAARLGAREVVTCEAVPLIAATAGRVISDNGFEKSIRIIPRRSTQLTPELAFIDGADVLVSEIFSSELLAEGVLHSIEDAKARLLKPGCRVVPDTGSIMIALFGGDEFGSNLVVGESCGFDLKQFNSIIAERQTIPRKDLRVELLTKDVEAFRFHFERDSFFPSEEKTLRVTVEKPGVCLGIIQWIRLGMGSELEFTNHPSMKSATSSWHYNVFLLPAPVKLEANQTAIISAAHNRNEAWISLQGVENYGSSLT